MDVIKNNPFRILGVYVNASIKDIRANEAKAKAFLNVGKEVTYLCDFNHLLSPIQRTADLMASANSQLTLPNEKIKHALFWFAKATPLDEIAFNHLANGNAEQTMGIWKKKECFSSLLNTSTQALAQGHLLKAVDSMMTLLESETHRREFITAVTDETFQISEDELVHTYLDVLIPDSVYPLLELSTLSDKYKNYVKEKLVTPVIADIEAEITKSKSIKRENSSARYNAGIKLMNFAKSKLTELRKLLVSNDMRYQIIADKLGLEILQCGIDYYNNSDDADVAHKAMKLQGYAQSVVVGQMAKDRCKQNTDILKKIIAELPPLEVIEENEIIKKALKEIKFQLGVKLRTTPLSYSILPETSVDDLSHVSTLLQTVKPCLYSMKAKNIQGSKYYSQIIDLIVNTALSAVIDYVNVYNNQQLELNLVLDRENTLRKLRNAIRNSKLIMNDLESFDMSYTLRSTRFNTNRDILNKLSNQLGISPSSSSNNSSSNNSGCMIWIVLAFALGALISCI